MGFMFENLKVYQRAVDFAEDASELSDRIVKGNFYLKDQLNRAALSISANIAEGNGRWHKKDRKRFFFIARGSASECVPILELCKRKGFIDEEGHDKLKDDVDIICKMLTSLANGAE